jgi:hypothetical protein
MTLIEHFRIGGCGDRLEGEGVERGVKEEDGGWKWVAEERGIGMGGYGVGDVRERWCCVGS